MENSTQQKTPFLRLVIASFLCLVTCIPAFVLVMAGIVQFSIIRLVGPENMTAVFGLAGGISGIAIVVLNPIGGRLADRTPFKFGKRRTWILLGSVLGGLSMVMLAYAPSVPVLIVSYCLIQFFYGMVALSAFSLVPEQIDPSKFGKVSGILGSASSIGIMIGFMIVGAYAEATIIQKVITIALVQLVASIIAVCLLKDNGYQKNITTKNETNIMQDLKTFYPSPKKYPNFTWTVVTKLFMSMANTSLNIMSIFYITRFHLGETEIFRLNGITGSAALLMAAAGIIGGFLSDKFKKQKIFVISAALLSGVCLVGFAFTSSITFIIIGTFIFNFAYGMYFAVENAIVNRVLPSKEDACKDIAIINTTTQLASAIVSFATPLLISLGISLMGGDGYTLYFIVLAAATILAALTVLPIPEIGKSESENNNEIVTE
jgi:Major Facilitator Superfamily.